MTLELGVSFNTNQILRLTIVAANYLSDLWIFDTQEYRWKQVEFKANEPKPS